MECLPAIDVRGGRCVRLLRGSFDEETVYGDPVEQALAYVEAGAPAVHVVDLDAARSGRPVNREVVLAIVAAVPVPVQYGGGVRDAAAAEEALGAGIARVVLGTFAVAEPAATRSLAERFPGRIVVGLDHRPGSGGREVAVRGWEEGAGVRLEDALDGFAGAPLGGVVVTDIARDGTLAGPDVDGYRELLGATALPLVASGGIGGVPDLVELAQLEAGGRRLAGAILGRALLEGRLTVEEAVRACAP